MVAPDDISQAFRRAVESNAKSFGGNLRQGADDILARTQTYAKSLDDAKYAKGIVKYLDEGVYHLHASSVVPMVKPKPKRVEKTPEQQAEEDAEAIRKERARLFPGLKKVVGE